ncbi:hypothetical protein VR41_14230 [Streptomyces sp. NRRL B-1568]|nr:hypothetical protein VR41_14230 [Streptomyces sp. NRRL B-1568]
MPVHSRRRQTEQDRPARCRRIDLADLGFGASEADTESFDLAEPPLTLGFGDPVQQVLADLREPAALGRIRP